MMDEKKKAGAGEREAFSRLALMIEFSHIVNEEMWDRAKSVKGLRRDIALLKRLSRSVYDKLLTTIPDTQQSVIKGTVERLHYYVGCAAINPRRSDYGICVSYAEFEVIMSALLADHCGLCVKNMQEERQCPLRKALDTIGIDFVGVDTTYGCGYKKTNRVVEKK